MKERDMYYNYGGFIPVPNQNNNPQPFPNYETNYNINYIDDLNKRIDKIERQIKRLEQRITRIETPYLNNTNEPDNNMYMM